MDKKSTCQELEEKIHKQDELIAELSEIFNLSLDMIGIGSLDGYFIKISNSVEHILGYNKKEFLKKPFLFFVHGDDQEKSRKAVSDAQKGKKAHNFENRYRCKNGSYKLIEWKVSSVVEENKFMAVGRDITEKRQEEKKFKQIINGSIDGFAIADINGNIMEVNDAYCQLLGYTRSEVLSMALKDFEVHISKEELKDLTQKIIDAGGDKFEGKNKKKNGEIIDVEISASFTPESNGTFLVFIRDITDRKNSEKALISLNNDLDNKVKKRTDALKRLNEHLIHSENNERKKLAYELHDGVAQNLAMAVSKVKDIREGGLKNKSAFIPDIQKNIEMAIKDIRSLINQIHPQVLEDFSIDLVLGHLIESINEKKQVEIKYINRIIEPISLTETTQLTIYRATIELINNIIKHSGSSVAEIELSKVKNNIRIRIEDKGIGFDINDIHIKSFCGFGLYSLSERLENMGGNLNINSSLGKGTKALLTVPAK